MAAAAAAAGAGTEAPLPSLLTPHRKMRLMLPPKIIHPRDADPGIPYVFSTSSGRVIGKLRGFRPMFKGEIESNGKITTYSDIEIYPWEGEGLPWSFLELNKEYFFRQKKEPYDTFYDKFYYIDKSSEYGIRMSNKKIIDGKDWIVDYSNKDIIKALTNTKLPSNVVGKNIITYLRGARRSSRRNRYSRKQRVNNTRRRKRAHS